MQFFVLLNGSASSQFNGGTGSVHKREALMKLLRGSVMRALSSLLPEEIDLLVYT